MARGQFYDQRGLQGQQMQMTRGFTQADWAFQDTQRGMNWQWKQEDFQEQARFMTGRQRRLAERGMQRETITYNLEGERITTQRDQQKQLWNLEDERFEMERTHFEENQEFAKDQLQKQREFYEENKKLQEEELILTRKYQLESLALNMKSLEAQLKAAEALQVAKVAYDLIIANQQVGIDNWKTVSEFTNMLPDTVKNAVTATIAAVGGPPTIQGAQVSGLEGAGPAAVDRPYYWTPTYQGGPNPWANTVIPGPTTAAGTGNMIINLNIGNERFGSWIIDTVQDELDIAAK
jgi:hypothetical protein